MRKTFFITLVTAAIAIPALAQQNAAPATSAPGAVQLTVDEAVKLALDHNVDLSARRLDPQISDTAVAAAAGAFKPAVNTALNQNDQLQPPSGVLFPIATRTNVLTTTAGMAQMLPWYGTSYAVSWTAAHTDSNSILNSFNPLVQSGLNVTVSQPIVRNLAIDPAREQLATSRIDRDIADTSLREAIVTTVASTKAAYWNLAAFRAAVAARQSSLDLAQELVRVNKAKVDVGQSPPLDLVSAEAEVAADQEQLIIAQTAVKQAQDQLRLLIFDPTDRAAWNLSLELIDSPPIATLAPDMDAAVTTALRDRTDLQRARKDIEMAQTTLKFTGNQKLPDVRLNASYSANALGGTQVLRDFSAGFPGTLLGAGATTPFGSVLNQLFSVNYPTWTAGVSVSYPLGESTQDANYARARLERTQSDERLKSAEGRVIQQVRNAAWNIEMNAKRIETTRAARELAEQRLDAEGKRFDVGMSTSFLVIQAQRDLAQARTNELSAILAYDLSLVAFEAIQEAPVGGPAAIATGPVGASLVGR
ncbi:MAG TPA: TolC family protein [Vicinamibacterales bacterium]|jgi:HAE1 family hydrophobic/amphiphilic exporter-1